jgi:transposase
VVDAEGRRVWRGTSSTDPGSISQLISKHAGADAKLGLETGAMTPWLVHGLRAAGLDVAVLDARRVKAALQMRLNKTDQNDAEGLAQVVRTGWYRSVHVKSLDAQQARSLLGARAQLVGMRTRLSNMVRGVLKTFGLLPGADRGLRFDRRVEAMIEDTPEVVTRCGDLARPVMRARARFHRHHASRQRREERDNLIPPQLLAQHDRAVRIRAVKLENRLGQIDADCANLTHGRLLQWCFNTSTLAHRCR